MRTVSTTGCWLGTGAIFLGDSLHEFPRTPSMRTSQNFSYANFVERRYGELPRIPIPRTRVNKGMKEGRGLGQPRPSARDALAYREEPHLLLGEGVARQVLCPHAHNGLVDTATLQVGARV